MLTDAFEYPRRQDPTACEVIDIFCLMNRYDGIDEARRIADERGHPPRLGCASVSNVLPGVDPGAIAPFSISEAQRDRINRYVFWKTVPDTEGTGKWCARHFRDLGPGQPGGVPRYHGSLRLTVRPTYGDFLKKLGGRRMEAADARLVCRAEKRVASYSRSCRFEKRGPGTQTVPSRGHLLTFIGNMPENGE